MEEGENISTKKKFPVGIESFREIRSGRYYYVDKTPLIREIIDDHDKVNLITRPRRFGKSLNMDMLKTFFQIGTDPALFQGLKISEAADLCRVHLGKYPVISLSLKSVDALSFTEAGKQMRNLIAFEALRFQILEESTELTEPEKRLYRQLIRHGNGKTGMFDISPDVLESSLKTLTFLLRRHYGVRPILLIDEYDVPLEKAAQGGYYNEMTNLFRQLLGNALKTNECLEFAVLTGCLRVAKESIFTGLNNFTVFSVTDPRLSEYFGFTDEEVRMILTDSGMREQYEIMREWYDGYRFSDSEIYCPWDVISYCSEFTGIRKRNEEKAQNIKQIREENREKNRGNEKQIENCPADLYPKNYWINSSGNDVIRELIANADDQIRDAVENLIAGETVEKEINDALTYGELYHDERSIWSLLLSTGYLTVSESKNEIRNRNRTGTHAALLRIPNLEIRSIFIEQIMTWFQDKVSENPERVECLCSAIEEGNAETFEACFNGYLQETISIRDTAVRNARKENFYHGILLGLCSHRRNWIVRSNAEAGDGYSDILILNRRKYAAVIIEMKYADSRGAMESACQDALDQISHMRYDKALDQDDLKTVYKYGVACYKKECRIIAKTPEC